MTATEIKLGDMVSRSGGYFPDTGMVVAVDPVKGYYVDAVQSACWHDANQLTVVDDHGYSEKTIKEIRKLHGIK